MASYSSKKVNLRSAGKEDLETFFRWRNLPEIISLGSSQKAVKKNEHKRWFCKTIKSKTKKIFVICQKKTPIGQMRFELRKNKWIEISIYLLRRFRGFGFGVLAINKGCRDALTIFPKASGIFAFVRENNIASLQVFQKAGFEPDFKGPQRAGHRRFCLAR